MEPEPVAGGQSNPSASASGLRRAEPPRPAGSTTGSPAPSTPARRAGMNCSRAGLRVNGAAATAVSAGGAGCSCLARRARRGRSVVSMLTEQASGLPLSPVPACQAALLILTGTDL